MKTSFFTSVLIALLLGTSGFAITENSLLEKYTKTYVLDVYSKNLKRLRGVNNSLTGSPVDVAFLKFQNQEGSKGTVVISAGRAESALKFIELAEDLLQQGFSTVYVLDQRGQGLSTRLHENSGVLDPDYEKVHLDQFGNLTLDLSLFIRHEVLANSKPPYFAIGHITGALPLVDYVQKSSEHSIFSKIVLVSPLFKLKTGRIEQVFFDWVLAPLYSFSDDSRIPFQKRKNQLGDFKDNNRTHSERRFELVKKTIRDVPSSFSENSTFRWAKEIFKKQSTVLSSSFRISTPTLIVTAKADQLLDNSASENFCRTKILDCSLIEIEGSKHWVLFENDPLRNQAMGSIFKFFNEFRGSETVR